MADSPRVRFRRLESNPDLPLPDRATVHSAGHDVRSAEPDFELAPGEIRAVATGLVMELPPGLECQVRPRSGLALKHGITLPNSPGTIDPDYRGELKVIELLDFCDYFLVVHDIVAFAEREGIPHVGRGSAANSSSGDRDKQIVRRMKVKKRMNPNLYCCQCAR